MSTSIKNPPKIGRPSLYTDELAREICSTIATTTKGLPTLCVINSHWPSYETIYAWMRVDGEQFNKIFSDMYAKAKEDQADYLCEDILRIIDKPETFTDESGQERNDVAMMRLKVDSLKWQAMKLKPRRWGDKTPTLLVTHEDDLKSLSE